MDAITLLTNDHRKVESLFKEFEASHDPKMKKQLVDKMVMELSVHSAIEETEFYPKVKSQAPDGKSLVHESLEEHQKVKEVLAELDGMKPEESGYDAKVQLLIKDVKHHVKEEEGEMFPKVRAAFSQSELTQMGKELEDMKTKAPTHPHPMAPNKGVAGKVAGMAAGAMDRASDMAHPDKTIREDVKEQTTKQKS